MQAPTKPSLLTNRPEPIPLKGLLAPPRPETFHPTSTSLFGGLPSGEKGNRQGITHTNPVTRSQKRRLQRKRSSTNPSKLQGKLSRYDFPFSYSTREHSFSDGGREVAVLQSELATHYTGPVGLTDRTGLRNRTARLSLAVQNPFSPCTVTHTDLSSGRGNKESPTKRSHFRGSLQPQCGILQQYISCGKAYQFTCLPFGLTSAPRTFTMVLKPTAGILRKMGIRIILYLDDMLIMNSTFKGAREDILTLKCILESLGFLINLEKSIFIPVQVIEFLGIFEDSTNMRFLLPEENVAAIQKECRHLVSRQVASLSQLSHIEQFSIECRK